MSEHDYQGELDGLIDQILGLLETASADQVELDPLATIMNRMQARGLDLDLDQAPPLLRMLLAGMQG
jgi:hypothetical protein